jgi:acyl-CoA synthetase (AMP-forming)/AMP-acid ligase II
MTTAASPGASPGAPAALSLGDWVDASADLYPDRRAFVCLPTGRTVTFAESAGETGGIARGLRDVHGIGAGDRVAVLATDCHLYVELFLACAKLGATVVPLNYRLPEHELRGFVERSGARLLVVGAEYAELAAQVAAATGVRTTGLTGAGRPEEPIEALTGFEPLPSEPCDDDAIFALCFTSGTTGTAKAVQQPQRMLKQLISTFAIEYEVGDPAEEFRYSASPMFHVAGISIVLLGVARGFPMLVQKQFDAETTRHWMADGLTNAFLVPTMLRMILDLPGTAEMDFDSLRSILYGASPMTPGLLRECMDTFGCDFVNVFGAGTETGLQAILRSSDHRRARWRGVRSCSARSGGRRSGCACGWSTTR